MRRPPAASTCSSPPPAGLALLLGHRWNRIAPTVVYEDLGLDGYQPAYDIPA